MLYRRFAGVMALVLLLGTALSPAAKAAMSEPVGAPASAREQLQPIIPSGGAMDSYIVRMDDAPLLTYKGGVKDLAPTSPAVTGVSLRETLATDIGRAYRAYLADRREDVLSNAESEFGRSIRVLHEYDIVFNGMALELTPAEAKLMAQFEGVKSIQRDQIRQRQTEDAPNRSIDTQDSQNRLNAQPSEFKQNSLTSEQEVMKRTQCSTHR